MAIEVKEMVIQAQVGGQCNDKKKSDCEEKEEKEQTMKDMAEIAQQIIKNDKER